MRSIIILGLGVYFFVGRLASSGQTNLHRIASITNTADNLIELTFAGNVSIQFQGYFDLYTLEAADTLPVWSFSQMLLKTNASSAPVTFVEAPQSPCTRFYRTLSSSHPTPFYLPTGPYPVGTTSMLVTDPSRVKRYNVATNSSFMISLWFPARPAPASPPAIYLEPKLTASFANLYGVSQTLLINFSAPVFESASLIEEDVPYPVIIYSHGFRVGRRDNTSKLQELASHGYVVVAIDHADCLASVFPDGRVLTTTFTSLSQELFDNDLADVRFVLDILSALNASDPRFKGALDLQNIGTMGWSYGGGVAAEICRTDPRVKATALLEAYLQNAHDVASLGVQKPLLGLYNATSAFTTAYDQNLQDAYWMRIQNTDHQTFADWRGWIASPGATHRHAAVAMNACILSFFDKHLKGRDSHLLDNPAAAYPEITGFMKK